MNDGLIFALAEYQLARDTRNLCIGVAIFLAIISLIIAVFDIHAALIFAAFGGCFASIAIRDQRRADSILERALAASLVEGDEPTKLREAA